MSEEQSLHLETTRDLLEECRERKQLIGEQCFILDEAKADPVIFDALSEEDQEYLERILLARNHTVRVFAGIAFP